MAFQMEPEKKIMIEGGVEITYYELGAENEEVLIVGQWYYYTFMDWLRALAKDLHVYAIVLRGDGPVDQIAPDGNPYWEKQWGEDIVRFAKAIGLEKFIYGGKCHGSFPGWYLVKEHKDMLKAFIASSWVPNRAPIMGQKAIAWRDSIIADRAATIATSTRFEENVQLKLEEMDTIDASKMLTAPNSQPLNQCKDIEEIYEYLSALELPIMVTAGYDDPLMDIPTLVEVCNHIPKAKVVLYPGERHFYEMDIPERLASEWTGFIHQVLNGEFVD